MNNEWIFDNASSFVLQRKVHELEPHLKLNFDVNKIKWEGFIQNHAYGVKKYILKEEAYMPSHGFRDARAVFFSPVL